MKAKISIPFLIAVFFCAFSSYAQLTMSPELRSRLTGKRKYADIMAEVDNYYRSHNYKTNPELFKEYKKWNRWAWFAVRHLNEQGEIDYRSNEIHSLSKQMDQQLSNRIESNNGQWTFVGPTNTSWTMLYGSRGIGRVDRLAFHPTDPLVILAGTPAGGLWRTNNGGSNWFPISSNVPNCGISGIVIGREQASGNTIYILTGDGDSDLGNGFVDSYLYMRRSIGVLYTSDGGQNWSKLGNSESVLSGRICYKLIQLRTQFNVLIAATDNGIYRSVDWGQTWGQAGLAGAFIFDIEEHPTTNNLLYASGTNSVARSTDGGATFTVSATFSPAISSSARSAIAVTPANPNEVYYLQCGNNADQNRIYRSTDSGISYTSINNTNLIAGQYTYNCSFAVNPTDRNFILTGGIGISRSTNNGVSFPDQTTGQISGSPQTSRYVHPDIHDLAYNPLNAANGVVYAACDGGVYISLDNGLNWIDQSNGLSVTQYYHMTGFNGVSNLLLGSAQDNGTTYTTNGTTMNYCGRGDGFMADFVRNDNNLVYEVENTDVMRFNRTTFSLVEITPPASDEGFYPSVIAHPTNGTILYVGYATTLWRSNNQGNSWTDISNNNIGSSNGGAGHTGGFAMSAATPDRIYFANATTVRRSDDQGANWTTISGNSGWPTNNFGVITDIATRNNNSNEVWITVAGLNSSQKVYYSNNAGASWINFTGTLPNVPIYCIAYTDAGDAYVGTELGVFFMDVSMTDWVPFYNGLPRVPVSDLFVNETMSTIQASTFGRGIWQSDLYSDCPGTWGLSGNITGYRTYQATTSIQTSQYIGPSIGNDIRYRSPRVRLAPGFVAAYGSYMKAVAGPCGQYLFRNADQSIQSKKDHLDSRKK